MTAEREQPRQPEDEGGRTAANNMAALSRRHHRAKTFLGFHYRHLDNAVLEWTTPLGRTYYTRPHDYRPEGDTDTTGDSDPPRPAHASLKRQPHDRFSGRAASGHLPGAHCYFVAELLMTTTGQVA